ncbi:MAG: hypothetical protein U0796_13750 [Gemmatales bacterium]
MFEQAAEAMKPMIPLLSLAGSTVSLGVTSYFWFVKMNRERPRLLCESMEHASFIDLDRAEGDFRSLHFRLALVVVNESILPNAVVKAEVHAPEGDAKNQPPSPRPVAGSNFPLNLLPMQSGLLTIEWQQTFGYLDDIEARPEPADIVEVYLEQYWKSSSEVTVKLRGLRGTSFRFPVKLEGSRMSSTVRAYLEPAPVLRRVA